MGRKAGSAELQQLLAIIDQAYDRASWHGTNLRGSIRRVSARQAAWRPDPRRHSIGELVVHCAYWKYAVWRRLSGQPRGSFPIAGSNWFARSAAPNEEAWREDVALLERMHRQLRAAIEGIAADALSRRLSGSRLTPAFLISGIAAHDLYHAGQVQLLKKLAGNRRGAR